MQRYRKVRKVQEFLESNSEFSDRVERRPVTYVFIDGTTYRASHLASMVLDAMKKAGHDMREVNENSVDTYARQVLDSWSKIDPNTVLTFREDGITEPEVEKCQKTTKKPVVVVTARSGQAVDHKINQVAVVQTYQCAVASAQLLAALHQLFEHDTGPGYEERRSKLDELIELVEKESSRHINLSVKAILRAKDQAQAQSRTS